MTATKRAPRQGEGRPSKYDTDIIDKTSAYYDKMLNAHKAGAVGFPSIAELSLEIGVSRKVIYEWLKDEDKQQFRDICEKILALQELSLHDNGLIGKFNATITKLMLTKHGYVEKTEQDITSGGEKIAPVLVKFIDGNTDPK